MDCTIADVMQKCLLVILRNADTVGETDILRNNEEVKQDDPIAQDNKQKWNAWKIYQNMYIYSKLRHRTNDKKQPANKQKRQKNFKDRKKTNHILKPNEAFLQHQQTIELMTTGITKDKHKISINRCSHNVPINTSCFQSHFLSPVQSFRPHGVTRHSEYTLPSVH